MFIPIDFDVLYVQGAGQLSGVAIPIGYLFPFPILVQDLESLWSFSIAYLLGAGASRFEVCSSLRWGPDPIDHIGTDECFI